MSTPSQIEWTEMTWNPVTGCTKVSEGCRYCYAERLATRLKAMGQPRYSNGFRVTLHPLALKDPLSWRKGRMVFVNSMSDLFHADVPQDFVRQIFDVMHQCPQHTFQILTKRSKRLREKADALHWVDNIWMGVSVEDKRVIHRIEDLRAVPASVRFLSCEPLLGPLDDLQLEGIHWVIVGGESGPHARPMKPEWVDSILEQCNKKGIPFFFKQWGGVRKDLTGRSLHGRSYDQMPHRAASLSSLT